jgi:Probable zinc-ribbon domain
MTDGVDDGRATPGDDVELICAECGEPFIFTAGQREWFASRALFVPRRCPECRAAKRPSGLVTSRS